MAKRGLAHPLRIDDNRSAVAASLWSQCANLSGPSDMTPTRKSISLTRYLIEEQRAGP